MSASNTKIVQLGDNEFTIRRFNAFMQLEMFGDLQKELLPAVSELLLAVAKKPESEKDEAEEGRVMAEGIAKLSAKLGGERLGYWSAKLIQPEYVFVSINGAEPVKLDKAMQSLAFQDFTEIATLMFEVIKFNFAGPLMGFLSRIGLDTSRMNTAMQKL